MLKNTYWYTQYIQILTGTYRYRAELTHKQIHSNSYRYIQTRTWDGVRFMMTKTYRYIQSHTDTYVVIRYALPQNCIHDAYQYSWYRQICMAESLNFLHVSAYFSFLHVFCMYFACILHVFFYILYLFVCTCMYLYVFSTNTFGCKNT